MGKKNKVDTRTEMQKLADVRPDKYIGCIPGVADGWFTEEDAQSYKELVEPIKNGRIIEVGAYEGLSLYHIKDICKANNTSIIAVDFMPWEQLVKNTAQWGIPFIHKPSVEAATLFEDDYFDLVFLDADHHTRPAARDVQAWLPKVKKDGIFAGHDYNLGHLRKGVHYWFDIKQVTTMPTSIWYYREPHKYLIRELPKNS